MMPIVLPKEEWDRIKKWTNPDKEDPEIARRRQYLLHVDKLSKEMTKEWPNSLENVNKRNEEQRRARTDVAAQANARFYRGYVRREQERQQRLMHGARDDMFKNKDAPKMLLSAVIRTVVEKERLEQLKFNKFLKDKEAEKKRNNEAHIQQQAEAWHKMMEDRKKKRFHVNKENQKELLDQIREHEDRSRSEHEEELSQQKLDNIKADQEMKIIKEFEEKLRAEEKARIHADMSRARSERQQREREQREVNLLDDRLQEVLTESNKEIQRRRKEQEKKLRDEKLRVLAGIQAQLKTGTEARDKIENEILDKAVRERDKAIESHHAEQQRKLARMRQERVDARREYLQQEELRLRDMHTMRTWEAMNRFKNLELYEEYKEKIRLEEIRKKEVFKRDILAQWKERYDREAEEAARTKAFYGEEAKRKMREEDNKLLTHAQRLLEEARAHQRPDYALRKAIHRYCKIYGLYPMPVLPKTLQSHFPSYRPWDGTAADPWYREPPAPPPDRGPDPNSYEDLPPPEPAPAKPETAKPEPAKVEPAKPAPPVHAEKAYGLQEVKRGAAAAAGPSQAAGTKRDEHADYRRVGRANGLQNKCEVCVVELPPIAAPHCACPGAKETNKT